MLYLLLGLGVSALGTLVGVGGGFLLVPFLLFWKPELTHSQVTGISLFCIALNATSGSVQYLIRRRVHVRAGVVFALLGIPGMWLGIWALGFVGRESFQIFYAFLLCSIAAYMLRRLRTGPPAAFVNLNGQPLPTVTRNQLIQGGGFSLFVGAVAGFFGVGGGILYVPFLNRFLKFPMHYATATSQFILAITALASIVQHFQLGSLPFHEPFLIQLAIGMIVGAQLGAWVSPRVDARLLVRILAYALLFIALRIFWLSLGAQQISQSPAA